MNKLIEIINDKKFITESSKKIIKTPYGRFDTIISITGLVEEIKQIIFEIDACNFDTENNLISKFTQTPIEISNVSDGCKTVVAIWYNIKRNNKTEIINITSCGANAIKYILEHYKEEELQLYLQHYEIPRNIDCTFRYNGEVMNNTNDIFAE